MKATVTQLLLSLQSTNPMPNIITINSNEYIEFNLGSDVYRLISPGFNLAFTEKESEPFHWTPDLHLTTIDENIATVEMNGTVARIVPNQNEAYGETTLMLRDDNSDISFIFKVSRKPTQEEKYGTDTKYAAPKVVNG